jgi:Zn-dependent peptidase ImmA (M78 family)/transcriptional regulator with XRE-family HTH domain
MDNFNGHMLSLAREIRKVSQAELVERVGGLITQGTLSKIERGRIDPSSDVVDKFAEALDFNRSFFFDQSYLRQPPVSYHRYRTKLGVKNLSSIHGIAEMVRLSLRKCLASIDLDHDGPTLPTFDVDQFAGDVEEAARLVRARLNIPRGPLNGLTQRIEACGVIVVPFSFGSPLIDGFCQHEDENLPSLIFLNSDAPLDRRRYSLAHEVAHLCLHDVPNPDQEIQANRFAAELLMPAADIREDLGNMTLNKAIELKLYWGVSMQAIVYRSWELGRISKDRMTNLFIELSRRGWRKKEPVELRNYSEEATAFKTIVDAHLVDLGYTEDDLAEMFGLNKDDLHRYFPLPRRRPSLKLVSSS